jgi:hypothetical protein
MAVAAKEKPPIPQDDAFEVELLRRITSMVKLSDFEEDMRRASDARGSNIYLNRHYAAAMPKNRAATVNNQARAIVDHKIALMTKQDPIPVVEPSDVGDQEASRMMRAVLQDYWVKDEMMMKTRQALRLANTTRTCASKTYWDPEQNGDIGGIRTDIIPGYRLILDPRTQYIENMEFAGDRANMSRSRAMKLYPRAADKFRLDYGSPRAAGGTLPGSRSESPIQGPFKVANQVQYAGGAIVNGKPTITAFTGRSPVGTSDEAQIQLIELFWRDRTLVEKEVAVRDSLGNPEKKLRMDGDMPVFEQIGEWDDILGEPGFQLAFDDVTRTELAPKYPYWRKSVLLVDGGELIDDRAWDAPLPYELLGDNPALEGPWDTGCILNVEHKQAMLNVTESTMLDNLRFGSTRAFKTSDPELAQKNNLVISPGDVVYVSQDPNKLVPLEFPTVQDAWFKWKDSIISDMERIIGVTGIMQGEAAGRVDSAAGYDTLAQTSGARVVECTQRMERWISRLMAKVGWYAQRYYTERHAVRVEDLEGNLTWERAASTQLMGTFSYRIEVGSTMAWNEAARNDRLKADLTAGIIDKQEYWQRTNTPNWREIKKRLDKAGIPLTAPPPRTRQTLAKKKPPGTVVPH